jgi:hypothetical protein
MRTRIIALLFAPMLALGGCRGAEVMSNEEDVEAAPARAVTAEQVPEGTSIVGTLDDTIGTKESKVGDQFTVTVTQPITAEGGETVVPAGSKVVGRVTAVQPSKHVGEQAAIKVDFDQLRAKGRSYPLKAEVVKADVETNRTNSKYGRNIGVGAAGGAALGAIFGRSWKGALIGGAVGAATGTAISLGTGDVEAHIPAGTRVTLRTTQDIDLEGARPVSQNP